MENKPQLKAYSLVNSYCKGIQAGIQAAHSQSEMIIKELESDDLKLNNDLHIWRENPVMILKRGGDCAQLKHLLKMCTIANYPFGAFWEDGLDGALTSITILLPDVKTMCARDEFDRGRRPLLEELSMIEQEILLTVYKAGSAS